MQLGAKAVVLERLWEVSECLLVEVGCESSWFQGLTQNVHVQIARSNRPRFVTDCQQEGPLSVSGNSCFGIYPSFAFPQPVLSLAARLLTCACFTPPPHKC